MQIVTADLIKDKRVLLRLDIDVPIENREVIEDFRIVAGMPTLELCLEHARKVVILGHIGRPNGERVERFAVDPIYNWLEKHGFGEELESGKLRILENLRFEKGEEEASVYYAKELANFGDFYINEAFASHHKAASTTVLPMLLPHAAGLKFAEEVKVLTEVRDNPKRPLVVIIGGAKVEDKLPAALAMAKIADRVLIGGKIAKELSAVSHQSSDNNKLPENVLLAELTENGEDITTATVEKWLPVISSAKMILWNGPLGYIEDPKNSQTERISQMVIESGAETIVGGGDTISYLDNLGDLPMYTSISTGGGAMLKFLEDGTLPTIQALK